MAQIPRITARYMYLTPGPSYCERGHNVVGPSRYVLPYSCLLWRCVSGRYWPARHFVCRRCGAAVCCEGGGGGGGGKLHTSPLVV